MSAQIAKKKRTGSRRQLANQNKSPEADDFHTDRTFVAQHNIPEENTEELYGLGDPDSTQSHIQRSLSPELAKSRRKLGSSRRNKGGVKDLSTESQHKPREDVEEQTGTSETSVALKMSLAIQSQTPEELSQEYENEMPSRDDSSLYLARTPDYSLEVQNAAVTDCPEDDWEKVISKIEKWPVDRDENDTMVGTIKESQQCNSAEEDLPNFCSVTEKEIKEKVMDTELCIPGESTELEYSARQTIFSLPNELKYEKNEHLSFEDSSAQHIKDALNNINEEEIKTTQIHQSSKSVTHDALNSEIISGNPLDQTEITDNYQYELIAKSTNDSKDMQKDSNLYDKQDVHPAKENNVENLEHTNEAYVHTNKPQISGFESVLSEIGQVCEMSSDTKPSAEPPVHPEKVGLFELESNSSSQTLQSEMHACLDSQPQKSDTNSIEKRRKLGSTRRNKGRRHANESVAEAYHRPTDEAVGNTSDNELLETAKMSLTIETELSDQVKENAHDCTLVISELSASVLHSISSDQFLNDQLNSAVMPNELPHMYSVIENKDRDTEMLRQDENYLAGESHVKSQDTESSIIPEIITESQTEFSVEDAGVLATKEESSSDKEHKHNITLSHDGGSLYSFDVSEEHGEADKQTHMQEMHRTDNSLIGKGEYSLQSLQSEIDATFDHQPRDNSLTIEEGTHTSSNPIGNRMNVGSSHRNEGLQESKDLNLTMANKALKTTQLVVAMEGATQEELEQGCEEDIVITASHDNLLNVDAVAGYSSEVQNPAETSYPEADMKSFLLQRESLQEDNVGRKAYFKVELLDKSVGGVLKGMDTSESLQAHEDGGSHHSENAESNVEEPETKPAQIYVINHSPESVSHNATQNSQMMSENLMDQAEVTCQSELSTDDSATKQEDSSPKDKQSVHPTMENNFEVLDHTNEDSYAYNTTNLQISGIEKEDTAPGQVYYAEGHVEDNIKPSTEQPVHQEKEGLLFELEESNSSSQTLQSKIHVCLDSQTQKRDTDFNPIGTRRKLGSSRRKKGRQHDCHRLTEETTGSTSDNETIESTKVLSTIETEVSDQIKENAHDGTLVGIFKSASGLSSSSASDQSLFDHSNITEMLKQDENVQDSYLVSESNVKPQDIESSIIPEIVTKSQADLKCSIKEAALISSKEESSSDKEHKDNINLSQDGWSLHSVDVRQGHGEVDKQAHMQEMHQSDNSTIKMSDSFLQSLQSEMEATLDCQPQDNSLTTQEICHTSFNPIGHRRKLGSSRRNKGRQHGNDCVNESYHRLREEAIANPSDNEPLETTEMSLTIETAISDQVMEHAHDGKLVNETFHEPQEEFVEKSKDEEAVESTKMFVAMTTTIQTEFQQQANLALQQCKEISSAVNDEEKLPEEDTVLSLNSLDDNKIVTTDVNLCSGKEDSVKFNKDVGGEEKNRINEPEHVRHPIGYDKFEMDSVKSPEDYSVVQNILYPDDNVIARSLTLDVLKQEDARQVQRKEALSHNDSLGQNINILQKRDTVGTVKEGEVERAMEVLGQDEVVENSEDLLKKVQEIRSTQEITNGELLSAAHNKADTSAPAGVQDTCRADPCGDVPGESGTPTGAEACDNQQGIQEKPNLDNSDKLQEKPEQKRRKMGSTRRTHLKRKPEDGMDDEDETKESNTDMQAAVTFIQKMEEAMESSVIVTAEVSKNENEDLQSSVSDIDSLRSLYSLQSASHSEEVVSPVTFVQTADLTGRERSIDVSVAPSQLDDFTGNEAHITSGHARRNTEDSTNTGFTRGNFESLCETTQSTQNDGERLESVNVTKDQVLKTAEESLVADDLEIVNSELRGRDEKEHRDSQATREEPSNVNEGIHSQNLEMKNASSNFNSTNRRRKMGSTRRNLKSQRKEENLHQKEWVDTEEMEVATNLNDINETVRAKDSDCEQRQEKVFLCETVEYSHTGESQSKPLSHQTCEEHPVTHCQVIETEHQLSPSNFPAMPSMSPKHDIMSETASGGRRRKLGSHRKSHGQQNIKSKTAKVDETKDTQNVSNVSSIKEESAITTTEKESLCLEKISEVDEVVKKDSSSISSSKAEEHSKPVSDKTPAQLTLVQRPPAEIHLSHESRKTLSLAGSFRGEGLRSNRYNVLMVGDSSVGKTSFMKQAQSGMFSLDLPSSVGLDSCMWTVMVDGQQVVLQLWDTAGQERFHSITRQIFHKAHAFLLMYDITSSRSFTAVSYWANCIQEEAAENVTILLLGNKSDCAEQQVKTQEGEILATEYNFTFMECSAATGENVNQALEAVARILSQKADTRQETMVLHKEPQQKKSSGCC